MGVEFKGPNPKFQDMIKHGGDQKVGSGKSVLNESVNHDNFAGHKELADKNPGSDRQNKTVHKENPFGANARPGMEQPKIGGSRGIGKEEGYNKPPRKFEYPS